MPELLVVNENDKSATVRLRNVRLSFPALFEPKAFKGEPIEKATYQATFLIPKDSPSAANMKKAVKEVLRMNHDGKAIPSNKICLQSGDSESKAELDGYDESVFFTSSNSRKAVVVVDRDGTPLKSGATRPYAGCFVNATVRIWWQNNNYGKRVNAQLRAVQFWSDGPEFGAKAADAEEEFADTLDDNGGSEAAGDDADWL